MQMRMISPGGRKNGATRSNGDQVGRMTMKKFVYLTIGFEKPTEQIMQKWMAWFESMGDAVLERGHLSAGRELSDAGSKELGMDLQAITGFMIVQAEDMDAAVKMAEGNPWITSIRIYELNS